MDFGSEKEMALYTLTLGSTGGYCVRSMSMGKSMYVTECGFIFVVGLAAPAARCGRQASVVSLVDGYT